MISSSMDDVMRRKASRKNRTVPQNTIMNMDTGVGLIGSAMSYSFLQAEFKDDLM